jgi:hypothetical protein
MSWADFTADMVCELCGDAYTTKNSRGSRLCPNCKSIEPDIRAVLAGKSFAAATDEDKTRIMERVRVRPTVRYGPFTYGKK